MTWYTANADDTDELERLQAAWPDAPVENLEVLGMVLDVARDQVLAYAPAGRPVIQEGGYLVGDTVPTRYYLAQLRQAQNIWNAAEASAGGGDIGEGAYVFTPRPMDKTIKQIIRPLDGKPHVL